VAAKKTFDCLIGQLADPVGGTLPHNRLEEMLHEQGRELLRQLLQAHLDLRALREKQSVLAARRDGAGVPARTAWCADVSRPAIIGCWRPFPGR
jgi:hypothetical protein